MQPQPGDDVLDARGTILVPPLINGHTHAAMTLFRGYGDDLPLMRWLEEKIWPIERRLEAEDVYWGTRLACLEMIRSGTVRFWDMYWHAPAAARAVADAGMRATVAAPLIDIDGRSQEMREAARRSLDELAGAGERIDAGLAPHAIYTVTEDSLRWIAELAAERDFPVQIHLSETEQEVIDCLAVHGERPARYLDRVGLLSPRTVLAHGVWLDDDELELISERGAVVVTNPVANLKLAVGAVFPYPRARAAGVQVGLGTDGPGSNNSLDLFADMKVLALLQKHAANDAAAIGAVETWEIATGRRAPLLGAAPGLEVGQPADFLLLRAGASELSLGELPAALVYAASGAVVHSTVVGGRVLMRNGEIEGAEEVLAHALERARGLGLAPAARICPCGRASLSAEPGMTASVSETAAARLRAASVPARGTPCALLMFGELALKGRRRSAFAAVLERNLRRAMRRAGEVELRRRGSSFLVVPPAEGLASALEVALELPGLSVVQPALRIEPEVGRAAEAAVELVRGLPAGSFAVRARRREKSFPVCSMDIAREVGGTINDELGYRVDLSHPDIELRVDAYARELFVSIDRLRGAGGLPVGTSGRAMVLLSGGIDSPVAAYRMMKRGLRCDFVHFSGQPLTGPESAYKAYALVARLNRFQGRSRLFVVPFGITQRLLATSGAGRLQVLAGRRLMVHVADALARREQCEALVTGDSLGQVASQTLRNLEVVEGAATLPLLRPLIDRDKSEIIEEAQRLGTFETSILPDEDCCTLLAPGRAVTWTDPEPLVELERRVDVETVVEQLVERAVEMWPRLEAPGNPADLAPVAA